MDMIETQAERITSEFPELPLDSTPAGGRSAPDVPRSSGGGSGGGGSSAGSSGSIEIKPRGAGGEVTSGSGANASIQRVGTDADPISNASGVVPNRILSIAVRRKDPNGRSKVIQTSTGKPADWVERARRSARRVTIANGGD